MENKPKIDEFGNKLWYQDGQYHRVDGPAIEYTNGSKYWIQDGRYHRVDGPAIEYANGDKHWYYRGKYISCSSQEEFEKIIKLKAFW